jgi:hypothetical protein
MAKPKQAKYCWQIRGYDSTTAIFNQTIPVGQITTSNLKELLRALAAKSLSPQEIMGAYAKRGTRTFNGFVNIRCEHDQVKRRTIYSCGQNPHFVATTIAME